MDWYTRHCTKIGFPLKPIWGWIFSIERQEWYIIMWVQTISFISCQYTPATGWTDVFINHRADQWSGGRTCIYAGSLNLVKIVFSLNDPNNLNSIRSPWQYHFRTSPLVPMYVYFLAKYEWMRYITVICGQHVKICSIRNVVCCYDISCARESASYDQQAIEQLKITQTKMIIK